MRDTTKYSDRVLRVVDYLGDHLDEQLDLQALSRLAHFSPYHFHRIYRAVLGETVHDTIRRLRLRRAAIDLLDRELSIERTATRAGYSTQAAFTRAFRIEYGEPPARYREAQRLTPLRRDEDTDRYDVEIVNVSPLRMGAIEHRGDYQLTTKAFERLMTIAATTGLLNAETRTIGICGASEEPRDLPCLEEYLNDPRQVHAKDLKTAVMMPLKKWNYDKKGVPDATF